MKIFITGAEGFIGSNLTPRLKEKGHTFTEFHGDILNKENLKKSLAENKFDAVIHLAAKYAGRASSIYKTNVDGTRNLIFECEKIGIPKIILISSIRVLSEFKNIYGKSKKEAENAVLNSKLKYVIIRPSLVYGPGDKKNLGKFLKLIKKLPLFPAVDFKIQPIFVSNLTEIIEKSLNLDDNKIINAVGKEEINFIDFLKKANKLGNFKCFIFSVPKIIFRSMAFFIPFRSGRAKSLLQNEVFKPDPWWTMFGVKPTGIEDGIKLTLRIFLINHKWG